MSKILALIAAGAFIFGGMLTSCKSSDDDDDDPSVAITTDTAISVAAGSAIDAVITATLTNTSFAGDIAANTDLSRYVTVTPSSTASFGTDLAITAYEAIAKGGTTAKVKISVTTTSSAVSGTVTITIDGTALSSGTTLTSNALAYTITSSSSGDDDSGSGSGSGSSLAAGTYAWDFTGYTETTTVTAGDTFKSSPEGLVMTIFAGAKDIKAKNNIYGLRMKVADDNTTTGVQISGLPVNTAFDIAYTYTGGADRTFTIADTDTDATVIDTQTGTSKADYTKSDAKTSTGTISISATKDCFLHTLSITIK